MNAVLIRKSTGEIIKFAEYPRADIQPVEGLDPDLEWLLKHEPYSAPEYDSRIFVLIRNESITTQPHPEYNWLNQYQITYETQKRPSPEIEVSVENAERSANESILPYGKQLKLLTLGLGVLFRKLEGLDLIAKEQVIADKVVATAVRLWKNDQVLRDKVAQLVLGEEPEIDSGWEKD